MVTVKQHRTTRRVRSHQREAWRDSIRGIHIASKRESDALFDRHVRRHLNISGDEFLQRWDAGFYRDSTDEDVERVAHLIPVVRRTRA